MSFREKSAWISFVLLLVFLVAFFWNLLRIHHGEVPADVGFHIELGLVVGFILFEILLHTVVALQAPHEARAPKDERERLIEMRATYLAFPVLVAGALASTGLMHVTRSAWIIGHHVLLAVVFALLVKFGIQVLYFRRGV